MIINQFKFIDKEVHEIFTLVNLALVDDFKSDLDSMHALARRYATQASKALPYFSKVLRNFRTDIFGDGVLRIRNLPADINSDFLTLLIGEMIGKVVKYEGEGEILMKIMRTPNADLSRPAHSNSLEFPPHTDLSYVKEPPPIMVIHGTKIDPMVQCESSFCSLNRILENTDNDILEVLQRPEFNFPHPPHYTGKTVGYAPILEQNEQGSFSIRFRTDSVEATTETGLSALDSFRRIVSDCTIYNEMNEGDVYVIANRRTLHGRTTIRNPSAHRVVNRAYVT